MDASDSLHGDKITDSDRENFTEKVGRARQTRPRKGQNGTRLGRPAIPLNGDCGPQTAPVPGEIGRILQGESPIRVLREHRGLAHDAGLKPGLRYEEERSSGCVRR